MVVPCFEASDTPEALLLDVAVEDEVSEIDSLLFCFVRDLTKLCSSTTYF
jgi:hypothetical protein